MAEKKQQNDELPEALVQSGLRAELMPQHVAFVMDGNRRWAEARGITTPEGQEAGTLALGKIIELSAAWGIRKITVFAFSPENFRRPQASKPSCRLHCMHAWFSSYLLLSLNVCNLHTCMHAGGGRLPNGVVRADAPR